jgi:hypothetical protein
MTVQKNLTFILQKSILADFAATVSNFSLCLFYGFSQHKRNKFDLHLSVADLSLLLAYQ